MDSHEKDTTCKSDFTKEPKNGVNISSDFCQDNINLSFTTSPELKTISRYGRAIKPKSMKTSAIYEYTTNLKMPKTIQAESIIEDDSLTMEDTSIIPEDASSIMEDTSIIPEDASSIMEDSTSIVEDALNIDGSEIKKNDEENGENLQINYSWTVGQLVWARIGGFPYWPSIVTVDPDKKLHVKYRGAGRSRLEVHVTYCADKGRHSWVSCRNVMSFEGLAHFEKLSEEVSNDKKKALSTPGFTIKSSLKTQWKKAVDEAGGLMTKSIEERIEFVAPKKKTKKASEKLIDTGEKNHENGKKRKLSSCIDETIRKKSKSDLDLQEINIKSEIELDAKSASNSLNLQTPPTPPLSHKDSSDEASTLKSRKNKKSSISGVFEVFCERNKESAEMMDPNASQQDIEEYLSEMWNSLSAQERSKYRADYLQDFDDEEDGESDSEDQKPSKKRNIKDLKNDDQEDTTSVESENLEKSSRKRRSKITSYFSPINSSDQDCHISIDGKYERKQKSKSNSEEKEESSFLSDFPKKPRQYKLFKGLKIERVCQICEQPGKIVRCKGPCYSYYHLACAKPGESPEPSEIDDDNNAFKEDIDQIKQKAKEDSIKEDEDDDFFKCIDCLSGVAPPCFACHERGTERVKCSVIACGKHYHPDCLKKWPQAHYQGERLVCPYHVCHMCISDNPQNGHHPRLTNEKFIRCVRCPSTYHASGSCMPAGSQLLTASQIICPKHYKSTGPPVNVTWCFICAKGGSLICCDTCPTSFHEECLGISAPDDDYICEDCETGRLPLYGEVVWVKHGVYRWWPSLICYPQEVPPNIASRTHKAGEFCVMFLGTRDYYWVHRGKVFLYHDGDDRTKVIGSKKVEKSYKKAVEEAKELYDRLTNEKAVVKNNSSQPLKPPPYKKLKVNKPVGNVKIPEPDSVVACECNPNQPNPCSPDSDCLNRILSIECSPDVCPAGSKCQNQLFAQRKYPEMKPFHTEGRGWGLKTFEIIGEGQFIIEYVGEVIDEAEYRNRLQQKRERKNDDYYFLTIDNYRMIDAEPKGNLSRFMNHSCQPNCETQKWTVNGDTRIGLFALRDIMPGEELTFNYNLACDGETRKPCLCNAPNCSGFIGLKVPKQQISIAQQSKIEKAEKVKKQKKQKKILNCWSCSLKIDSAEESYRCDQKTCGKSYHKYCIDDNTDQIFHCPWHFCAECHKRTTLRCNYCCNAFCISHTNGNLRKNPQTDTYVCHNHATEYSEIGNVELNDTEGELLMDGGSDSDTMRDNGDHGKNRQDQHTQKDELIKTDETVNKQLSETKDETSHVITPPQLDDSSPRGAIVEVNEEAGSEEDSSSRKKQRRKKQLQDMDNKLTDDQIAAIIGI